MTVIQPADINNLAAGFAKRAVAAMAGPLLACLRDNPGLVTYLLAADGIPPTDVTG